MTEIVNLNDRVMVKLTAAGRKVAVRAGAGHIVEDDQGRSKWLLWELMQVFGPHTHMGMIDVHFEMNRIEIVSE